MKTVSENTRTPSNCLIALSLLACSMELPDQLLTMGRPMSSVSVALRKWKHCLPVSSLYPPSTGYQKLQGEFCSLTALLVIYNLPWGSSFHASYLWCKCFSFENHEHVAKLTYQVSRWVTLPKIPQDLSLITLVTAAEWCFPCLQPAFPRRGFSWKPTSWLDSFTYCQVWALQILPLQPRRTCK